MIKRISGLILLVVMMVCSVSLSVTYSKFMLSKDVVGEVITKANCLDMGITSLSECMLVMDSNVNNVESAKLNIEKKQISANVSPSSNYNIYSKEGTGAENFKDKSLTVGKNYTFDSEKGVYTLTDYELVVLSDKYVGYYTCGAYATLYTTCTTMYYIEEVDADGYNITKATVYSYLLVDSFDSETGLYATDDDYGTSYYYRGNVKNNYVSYAGYIWRIVRQNGDGSIRMIYAGSEVSDTAKDVSIGKSKYNEKTWDPTYVGYMYGEDFVQTTSTSRANYQVDSATYWFAKSYKFDDTTKKYQLSGDTISSVWKGNYEQIISDKYLYTCFKTDKSDLCDYMIVLQSSGSTDNIAKAKFITYGSKDYASTLTNTYSSTVKEKIDEWYESNILNEKDSNGKLFSTYLSDNIFCNDRSFYSGDGYSFVPKTVYNSYLRNYTNKLPDLICESINDKFTSGSSTGGNSNLTYPIGLLTIDEMIYAGNSYGYVNVNNYLNEGINYWTMSPGMFDSATGLIRVFTFDSNAMLGLHRGDMGYYVRPVINLRADIKITSGDGTADNPYVVSL